MDDETIVALEKLHSLKISGAISDAEFDELKAKILEQGLMKSGPKSLIVVDAGPKKIEAIKALRTYTDADLKSAKNMVDNTPTVITPKPGLDLDGLKYSLIQLGATVEWQS